MNKRADKHFVDFGSQRIDFHVEYGQHERFRVTVHPDLSVVVNVPQGKPLDQVLSKVRTKAAWISRQIRYFEQFLPRMPERRFVSGETINYLGRQYRLKIATSGDRPVKLSGRYLLVRAAHREPSLVKALVQDWYKARAREIFERRLHACVELTRRHGIEATELRMRRMKGRWGSCSTSRVILLNTELVKAPLHCIDYVIVHELCHFRHRKHGDQFYRFLGKLMPDWQDRKRRLERVALDR
jgi:predicted metal-dependent hydrolase